MAEIGDVLECAIWLSGMEPEEMLARWKDVDCPGSLCAAADGREILTGPISFTVKRPGDDRVPSPPDHISGPDVRLLVAEAVVIGHRTLDGGSSFLLDLEPDDLARLRAVTRRAYAKVHPGGALSDAECDMAINRTGPDAALAVLRSAVDARSLH